MSWEPSRQPQKEIWIGERYHERCIRLYWEPDAVSCGFAIFPVVAYGVDDGSKTFYATEDQEIVDSTEDINAAWPETEGSVKWDGCTEVFFKQQHFCDARGLSDFLAAIEAARNAALAIVLRDADRDWVS